MNWNIIVVICEIIGAIALIVSLIYLAIQVKSQGAETRFAAMHDFMTGFRESIACASDSEIADIVIRGNHDIDSLTEVEKFRLASTVQQLHRVYEEAFYMHQQGRLDEDIWQPLIRQYSSFLASPSIRFVWEIRKHFYNDQFRKFVDNLTMGEYSLEKKQNNA